MSGTILAIVRIVLYLVIGAAALYFQYNTKLNQKATEYINRAEELYKDSTKSGGTKFNWVVDKLYDFLPAPMRLVFTKETIATLVQRAFDEIQSYAVKQLDKKVNETLK